MRRIPFLFSCWVRSLFLWGCLVLLLRLPPTSKADDQIYPSNITIRAAVIPSDTFDGFQRDLLDRLVVFAQEDGVTLRFEKHPVEEHYSDSLALISHDCRPGDSVFVNDVEYNCDDFDIIVGDYWTSPT